MQGYVCLRVCFTLVCLGFWFIYEYYSYVFPYSDFRVCDEADAFLLVFKTDLAGMLPPTLSMACKIAVNAKRRKNFVKVFATCLVLNSDRTPVAPINSMKETHLYANQCMRV